MPGVKEPLVVFLEEVAVGDIADLELEPEVFAWCSSSGREPLHVRGIEPAAELLERGHVRAAGTRPCRRRPAVGDDRRARAEHVVAVVLEAPDVEVAEVAR